MVNPMGLRLMAAFPLWSVGKRESISPERSLRGVLLSSLMQLESQTRGHTWAFERNWEPRSGTPGRPPERFLTKEADVSGLGRHLHCYDVDLALGIDALHRRCPGWSAWPFASCQLKK